MSKKNKEQKTLPPIFMKPNPLQKYFYDNEFIKANLYLPPVVTYEKIPNMKGKKGFKGKGPLIAAANVDKFGNPLRDYRIKVNDKYIGEDKDGNLVYDRIDIDGYPIKVIQKLDKETGEYTLHTEKETEFRGRKYKYDEDITDHKIISDSDRENIRKKRDLILSTEAKLKKAKELGVDLSANSVYGLYDLPILPILGSQYPTINNAQQTGFNKLAKQASLKNSLTDEEQQLINFRKHVSNIMPYGYYSPEFRFQNRDKNIIDVSVNKPGVFRGIWDYITGNNPDDDASLERRLGYNVIDRANNALSNKKEEERESFDEMVTLDLNNPAERKRFKELAKTNNRIGTNSLEKLQEAYRNRYDLVALNAGLPQVFNSFDINQDYYSKSAKSKGRLTIEHRNKKLRDLYRLNSILNGKHAEENNYFDKNGIIGTRRSPDNDPLALTSGVVFGKAGNGEYFMSDPWDFEINTKDGIGPFKTAPYSDLDFLVPHLYSRDNVRNLEKLRKTKQVYPITRARFDI